MLRLSDFSGFGPMLNLALSQDLFLTIRTLKIQFRLKMFTSELIAYCLLTNLAVTLKINLLCRIAFVVFARVVLD